MKIKKLTLFTSQLSKQIHFYNKIMGFAILNQGEDFVELSTGDAVLRFEEVNKSTPYHFAFNIPSNQIKVAAEWLKERRRILKDEGLEIVFFDFWDARAVYFYDMDNNIVEFIAREKMNIESDEKFSAQSVLGISEIGVPVKDIRPIFEHLNEKLSLNMHSGSVERFCAVGEESGLFIIIDKTKKKSWFPTNDTPISSNFNAIIENKERYYDIRFEHQKLYTSLLRSPLQVESRIS